MVNKRGGARSIAADRLLAALELAEYRFATGVPCSHLGPVIEHFSRHQEYLPAVNEGAAVAVAVGAELAGRRSVVLLQNSGLGNAVNPLASLAGPFEVPLLLLVSLRGWPDPDDDEPQHKVMGPATAPILAAIGIQTGRLTEHDPEVLLERAAAARDAGASFAILVPRHSLGRAPSLPVVGQATGGWTAREAVEVLARRIAKDLPDCAILSTTGYISRDLHDLADRPLDFFMQGSMGHLASLGLGVALAQPWRPVVLVDGDGAVLMHLGVMAAIGAAQPPNLMHVVVDNGCYESTGSQETISGGLDWSQVGRAVGYRTATICPSREALCATVGRWDLANGPHLIVAKVGRRTADPPPRATADLAPGLITRRFRKALQARVAACE